MAWSRKFRLTPERDNKFFSGRAPALRIRCMMKKSTVFSNCIHATREIYQGSWTPNVRTIVMENLFSTLFPDMPHRLPTDTRSDKIYEFRFSFCGIFVFLQKSSCHNCVFLFLNIFMLILKNPAQVFFYPITRTVQRLSLIPKFNNFSLPHFGKLTANFIWNWNRWWKSMICLRSSTLKATHASLVS